MLFAVTQQFDVGLVADRRGGDQRRQVGGFLHGFAVKLDDDVAVFDARFGGWRVFHDFGNERAMRAVHAEGFGQGLIQPLNQHAEPAAHHFALVFQLIGDALRHVDGDGESEAIEGAAAAVNLRVDGDNFAFAVEERAAGIAGVDRRIGLDERHIIAARQVAGDRADNALRRGVGEAEGRADGQHPVADLYLIGIAEFGDG